MTTLESSYCRPNTEEEWARFDLPYPYQKGAAVVIRFKDTLEVSNYPNLPHKRTEITVQHFIDLLNDRITPWRLLEVGFTLVDGGLPYCEKQVSTYVNISWAELTEKYGVALSIDEDATWMNIHTFTDLLTLIRFLTP